MKRLKKEFKSCGFYFKQLKRVDNIAIYEKTLIKPVCDRSSYEVIRISSHNGYKLGWSYIDPAETYPSNSMWGTHGFTADTLANAEKQFDKMQGRPDNPGSV